MNPENQLIQPEIPQPAIPQADNKRSRYGIFATLAVLAILAISFFYRSNSPIKPKVIPQPITPTVKSISIAPTIADDWNVYENADFGISMHIPPGYQVIKEAAQQIEIEDGYGYLIISRSKLIDFTTINECQLDEKYPCFNNKSWDQQETIAQTIIDGKAAKSVYYTYGSDGDHHVVQTIEEPRIQFDMYIAGGGLNENFKKILSSFKFIEKEQIITNKTAIPSDWATYNKTFGGAPFYFRYPPSYTVADYDEASGSIYVAGLTIDTFSHGQELFTPYTTGSRRVWFKNNLTKSIPDADLSKLTFKEIQAGSIDYLKVTNLPAEFGGGTEGELYFSVYKNIPFYVVSEKKINDDMLLKVLSSFKLSQ